MRTASGKQLAVKPANVVVDDYYSDGDDDFGDDGGDADDEDNEEAEENGMGEGGSRGEDDDEGVAGDPLWERARARHDTDEVRADAETPAGHGARQHSMLMLGRWGSADRDVRCDRVFFVSPSFSSLDVTWDAAVFFFFLFLFLHWT